MAIPPEILIQRQGLPHFKLFEKCCYKWWEKKGFHRESVKGYSRLFEEFIEKWYNGR